MKTDVSIDGTLMTGGSLDQMTESALTHFYGPGFDKILPISSAIAAELFETSQKVGPHDANFVLGCALEMVSGDKGGRPIEEMANTLKDTIKQGGEEVESLILKSMAAETASILMHNTLWDFGSAYQVSELRKKYLDHLRTML